MTDRNDRRLDKLVDKASLVLGRSLDFVAMLVERSMRRKIAGNTGHPLYNILTHFTALQNREVSKIFHPHGH